MEKIRWKDLSIPLKLAALGGYFALVNILWLLLMFVFALIGIAGGV
jgi:hypothetical protein